ncbi:type II toxin-antitoxin system VapC family toxin [uncultured Abyssibacter sp.]|uniref:type II toxin-antitoxin system VapC family toxin n=1 Tax=uncultured Abyssibacter sp. TaxID=2320202 RepID=UPI0032B1054E
MTYLLDTHTLLWWLADDPALPPEVRALIANPDNGVLVSAVSGWEIAVKRALEKLQAPPDIATLLDEEGFLELPIRFSDGERAGELPLIHRDPFDRMLVAQALAYDATILTKDQTIPQYGVATFWR